ncbi:hypothetical protein ACFPOU_15510 [Massilia jejuensis]|uniref:MFS transporter n=1 Tax=Massilia jejuensis TaxID=648894 RepID=A0ABW0PKD8_9BURK
MAVPDSGICILPSQGENAGKRSTSPATRNALLIANACLLGLLSTTGALPPYPILAPLFGGNQVSALTSFGGLAPTLLLGIALMVNPLGLFIGSAVLGAVSDRFGRRRILLAPRYEVRQIAFVNTGTWALMSFAALFAGRAALAILPVGFGPPDLGLVAIVLFGLPHAFYNATVQRWAVARFAGYGQGAVPGLLSTTFFLGWKIRTGRGREGVPADASDERGLDCPSPGGAPRGRLGLAPACPASTPAFSFLDKKMPLDSAAFSFPASPTISRLRRCGCPWSRARTSHR